MSNKLKKSNSYISVFIPVYNGEKYLGECIEAILNQELPDGYQLELIITDSGSTDGSLAVIDQYIDRVTLNIIDNSDFGHGKTRQNAAEQAKGDYILFITQDATPTSYRWIINMIEPFFISDKVGCVFGRQIPRPYSVPTIKREVSGVFESLGASNSIVIHNQYSLVDHSLFDDYNYFFSDVNSAIRKDLVSTVPFRDVKYAEDQALAEDMSRAGYIKAYSPRGAVWHSNEYSIREFHKRKFDEYIGLQETIGFVHKPSTRSLLLGWIKPTALDWQFIRRDGEYNTRAKIKYFLSAPIYNYMSGLGKYDAFRFINNSTKRSQISLEASRKNKK